MNNKYSSAYNKGFLPGPLETEEEFFSRIILVEKIINDPKKYIIEKTLKKSTFTPLNGAALLEKNKRNLFYHASTTTILEIKKNIFLPIISTPATLFVKKEEVLNHELVHARRVQFNENKFEEILAFRTSKSSYRRILSPIITTNTEIILFLSAAALCFLSPIPLLSLLTFFSIRLYKRHKIINRCISYLKKHTKSYEKILPAMTDSEIIEMSKHNLSAINFSLFRWKYLEILFGSVKEEI